MKRLRQVKNQLDKKTDTLERTKTSNIKQGIDMNE